jgi:hypothetical protein
MQGWTEGGGERVASIENTDGCFFAETMILHGYPFGGRIRLERLWEDRVMSDRGDGEGTVLVQASKGAALAPCRKDRPSFDSPILTRPWADPSRWT